MTSAPKKKRRGGSRPGRPLTAWQRSARFREVGLASLHKINRRRDLLPKCTAIAKSTGQQCQQLAIRGKTKCRFHGGATTRGDNWHRPRWPKPSDPRAMEKIDAKLRALAKNAKARDARLATLPPHRRAEYAAWLRAHKPGPKAARRRDREWRRQALDAVESLKPKVVPTNPEADAIDADIERLRALRARLLEDDSAQSADQPDETDSQLTTLKGVFA